MNIQKTEYLTKEEICARFPHKWIGLVDVKYDEKDTGKSNPIGGCVIIVSDDDCEVELGLIDNAIDDRLYTTPEDWPAIDSYYSYVTVKSLESEDELR